MHLLLSWKLQKVLSSRTKSKPSTTHRSEKGRNHAGSQGPVQQTQHPQRRSLTEILYQWRLGIAQRETARWLLSEASYVKDQEIDLLAQVFRRTSQPRSPFLRRRATTKHALLLLIHKQTFAGGCRSLTIVTTTAGWSYEGLCEL